MCKVCLILVKLVYIVFVNKSFILIMFILLSTLYCDAQKLNLQKYSVKEGLTQSTVKSIQQGAFGNIWLGTNYGVSSFNGKTFENFTTTNGLPSNEITALLFYNEQLFIGTKKGLCSYNGAKIEINAAYKKICGKPVKLLAQNNTIHVLTTQGYYTLNTLKNETKIDSIAIPSIVAQKIVDAEFDSDGNLWIATEGRGVFFIEKTISTKIPKFILIQNSAASTTINNKLVRIVNFNSNNLLQSNVIVAIEFDKKNNLFLSDWNNGIAEIKFDFINNTGFIANYINFDTIIPEIAVKRFTDISKDEQGNMYFSSDGIGVIKTPIDNNTNELDYQNSQNIAINNPLCVTEDKYQNLWIGTLNDGLMCVTNKPSISFNQKTGLEEEKIISIYHSEDSSIWLGTYGGGAFKYKNKKFTRCFWPQRISESIIKSIIEDKFGNILLGTVGGGISIINKENANKELNVTHILSKKDNLTSAFINYLYKDSKGNIWVGHQASSQIDKISTTDNKTYQVTTYPITNLARFNVTCIAEDDFGDIWITSNEGVWKLTPKTGYVNNEYSVFKNIQTIAKDWNGNMWLGTSDVGAIILKNKLKVRYFNENNLSSFEKISVANGISSNCVNTIIFDKDAAWFITNNGINQLKIDNYLNKIKEITSFNKGQGFASYDNKPNTAVFDKSQMLWIGSIEGLTQYQNLSEKELKENNIEANLYITSLLIDNKKIDWADSSLFTSGDYTDIKFEGYHNWYKIPNQLVLDYKHNSIQFNLSTDNISNQKMMNYKYKLIGYDKEWNELFNSNEISYRNLPPGDYTLVLKTSISTDFDNKKEHSYTFSIKPPFWKTTMFYVFISGISIMALYTYIVNREKRLKREKLKLELQVKARTNEIENQKREIELQNSLIQGINKDLTDSIKYAERIQHTILSNTSILKEYFKEHFIFYKPRNIVSGDYYWIKEQNNTIYVAAVDCTGHGVPGAFMSLITSNILNESINENSSPVKMLEYLRVELNNRLSQNSTGPIADGLDIALICFDKKNNTIEYVNANRPLYIISNNELITLASENVNIGGYADFNSVIPTKTITVKNNDLFVLFTDGITDQFGGEKNKKYNPSRLRQFLLMNEHLPLNELKEKLEKEINEWQGKYEQTDDILLIALKT
jgi:ligand-binding sensor domain-containing protein/serine phosphatase RsbU (regulator of sigma subunit)